MDKEDKAFISHNLTTLIDSTQFNPCLEAKLVDAPNDEEAVGVLVREKMEARGQRLLLAAGGRRRLRSALGLGRGAHELRVDAALDVAARPGLGGGAQPHAALQPHARPGHQVRRELRQGEGYV